MTMFELTAAVIRDTFDWWAGIIIPSIIGAGSVIVSVVAVGVSMNASRLAREVEKQREAASKERAADAARDRVRDMSVREAKLLRRWVVESRKPRFGLRGVPVGAPPPPPSALEVAETEARVELEHSVVPGAALILRLTEFDIENRRRYVEADTDGGAWRLAVFDRIIERRDDRTDSRIRAWAVNAEGQRALLQSEMHSTEDDPMGYLFFGESIEDALAE
jgi:hypothetical protein